MNLPKASALNYDSDGGEKRSNLRIIKIEKKKNAGDVDLSKFKKKQATNWKMKKENLKRMVKLDLLTKEKKPAGGYDRNRVVPREIHEQHSTEDELFLKIESGSQTTINTEASSRSRLENKLKNTKDKYMKYQNKAINKIKSFIPKSKSNENLKFMTTSDMGKSRTLVADRNQKTSVNAKTVKSKPPRPPLPANYAVGKSLLAVPGKPPIRPVRRKSHKQNSNSNLATADPKSRRPGESMADLPASVFYRELREKWLEKYASVSKSNLSSICSSSIPNYFDRKYSFLTNQSVLGDDFRYRYRAEYQSSLLLDHAERQSIKSEPTYALATRRHAAAAEHTAQFGQSGQSPQRPPRKRLTVSSYLSGSSLSLHRRINSDYFNANTDKSELATDALVWRPFSFKTNRVRSLTELYVRKNEARQSPSVSRADSLQQRNIDKLYQIYCTPKRPPLPVRYKKRNQPNSTTVKVPPSSEPAYHPVERPPASQMADKDYLKPHNQYANQFTNLHEVYTVRDAIVGPNIASYGEKEIQTSLEDFHDLDYDDEYAFESSPRFIDSSTNDEFESLAKTRNLSDDGYPERKIKRQLEIDYTSLERERAELEREIEEVLKEEEELLKEEALLRKEKLIEKERLLEKEKFLAKEMNKENEQLNKSRMEEEVVRVAVQLLGSNEKEPLRKENEEKLSELNVEEVTNQEHTNQGPSNQEPTNEEAIKEEQIYREQTDKEAIDRENIDKETDEEIHDREQTKEVNEEEQINEQALDEEAINEETLTLNEDYVTVQDSSSRTIGPYLDARQSNTLTYSTEDKESTYVTLDCDPDAFDTDTLADLDSLNEAYLTPVNSGSLSNTISRPKRTRRRKQLRNSGLDTEDDDEDEITDEIIGIAANLQKELKQLVEKQKD